MSRIRSVLRLVRNTLPALHASDGRLRGSGSRYKLPVAIIACLFCGLSLVFGLLAVLGVLSPENQIRSDVAVVTDQSESRAVSEVDRKARPEDEIFCTPSPGGSQLFVGNSMLGVAADPAGRFALYTRPNPRSGRPTGGSYPLLDGCGSGAPWYTNYSTVRISGPGIDPDEGDEGVEGAVAGGRSSELGLSTLERPVTKTREDGGGLAALHKTGEDVSIGQSLSLHDSAGQPGAGLRITYRVVNHSSQPRTVALRSTLNPGLASSMSSESSPEDSSLPKERYLVQGPPGSELARIRYEQEISAKGVEEISPVSPVGPAALYSWRPGSVGPPPDSIVFAAPSTLYAANFSHDSRNGYPLPPAAAFAVFWKDLQLAPGEAVTVSHRYGIDESPRPLSTGFGALFDN